MVYFQHPPSTLQIITVDFLYPQCELVWCSCTIHHVLCTMVWCTSIMHYATCILVQCTSTINHALCTLVNYISTMPCVASIGSLPPWTIHVGIMHSNNESCIVHICTLDFYYALCSFLGCTSILNYAPCSFKWWVLLCKVHLHIVQFDCARCAIWLCTLHNSPWCGAIPLCTLHSSTCYDALPPRNMNHAT